MVLGGLMRGEPLVTKLAAVARYGVLPVVMIAAGLCFAQKNSWIRILKLDTKLFSG